MCQGAALGDCEILVPTRIDAGAGDAPRPRHTSGILSEVHSLTRDVDVFGPLGKATWRPEEGEEGKDLLCIAGGSGVAGMMSILSHAVSSGHFERRRGHLFFGVRTREDMFFTDELARLVESAAGRLSVTVAFSDQPVVDRDSRILRCIDIAQGFVHLVAGERMAGAWNDLTAFVAGPPPMVDGALRMLVMEARLPASDIRYDKFT